MKKLNILIVFISVFLSELSAKSSSDQEFEIQWRSMQKEYQELNNILDKKRFLMRMSEFLHPYWSRTQKKIKNLILSKANKKFLFNKDMQNAMVRLENGIAQKYEECYLRCLMSSEIASLIKGYADTDFGGLPRDCKSFDCSINTLGHLYYVGRVLENMPQQIEFIIEFGAGYGNLARIFKSILPKSTIILIDLPELLVIQHLFLSATTDTEIIIHKDPPFCFKENAIHLVPVCFMPELSIVHADLFISTFALSEAPRNVQELVVDKNFFNAKTSYIVGQLNGWGESLNFVDHTYLMHEARNRYQTINLMPYHTLLIGLESYELIANNDS